MTLRIGIDFDNTIICYDAVFCTLAKSCGISLSNERITKQAIREIIQTTLEGERLWQRLQGKAYGEEILNALPFPGVKTFLESTSRRTDIEVFIVSHKTLVGHFDEKKIPLRVAAHQWLKQEGFFDTTASYIKESNVFFEHTRHDKIARITSLDLNYFIDDLPEIFDHPHFPKHTNKIWFNPHSERDPRLNGGNHHLQSYTSWTEIHHAILGK